MFSEVHPDLRASQVALVVKNQTANSRDLRDEDLIPGSGRSPREERGHQYSFLEDPIDRGAWQAKAHRVDQS